MRRSRRPSSPITTQQLCSTLLCRRPSFSPPSPIPLPITRLPPQPFLPPTVSDHSNCHSASSAALEPCLPVSTRSAPTTPST
eukprot:6023540-Pleurochrysis_carterae.AAC.1